MKASNPEKEEQIRSATFGREFTTICQLTLSSFG
jgi:hypothetical protein